MSPARERSIPETSLLAQLGPAFLEQAEEIMLEADTEVFPGNRVDFVYFPLSAMISITYGPDRVEAAAIGADGLVGCSILMGVDEVVSPSTVAIRGRAARMSASRFLHAIASDPAAASVVNRYLYDLMAQILRLAACSRSHNVKERTARWLIHAQECTRVDVFQITQERLGQLLGVRRATINPVLNELREEACVAYSRGKLRIVDQQRLASIACGCAGLN